MYKNFAFAITGAALFATGSANAAVNNVATYDFEDNAAPAGFVVGVGSPSYAGGEIVLDGGSGITLASTPLTATDNFAMEARLTPSAVNVFDFALGNTVGNTNTGYGILLENPGNWKLIRQGQIVLDSGVPVALNTEVTVAYVRQNGTSQLYLNGSPIGGTFGNSAAPTQFNIGWNPHDGAAGGFNGTIDEVRLSTFDGSDTLTFGGDGFLVPEPTSLALLGMGGLMVARRRRG